MSDRHYVHHEDEIALAKILKESKPWMEQYGTTLIYGLAAILAVAAVVVYIARRPPATAAESAALLLASTPEDYRDLADKTPNSPIGTVARLRQAELSLTNAMSNMFTNRAVGVEELKNAGVTFELLAGRTDLKGDLRERVLAGVARVLEAKCDGSDETTKSAIAAWEKLLKEFPDSKMFKDVADSRVKKLSQDSSKSFYGWFAKLDPKPGDDLQLPQDGPGAVPEIPIGDMLKLSSPVVPAEGTPAPAEGTPAPAEGTPAPAEGTPAPAEGTPAPAEGTPAPAEGTPAPAEGTPAPAEGTPAPAEGTPAPAEGTPAPAEGTPAPAEGTPAPAEGTQTPEKSGE